MAQPWLNFTTCSHPVVAKSARINVKRKKLMYKGLTCLGDGNLHEGRGLVVTNCLLTSTHALECMHCVSKCIKQSKLAATSQFSPPFLTIKDFLRYGCRSPTHTPKLHFLEFLAIEGPVA